MNRWIKHITDIAWVKLWSRFAQIGIGDPLNQLVYVAPFKVVAREPSSPVTTRRHTASRLSRKRTTAAIKRDIASMGQSRRKSHTNPHTPPQDTSLEIHDVSDKPQKIEGVSPDVIKKSLSQGRGNRVINPNRDRGAETLLGHPPQGEEV